MWKAELFIDAKMYSLLRGLGLEQARRQEDDNASMGSHVNLVISLNGLQLSATNSIRSASVHLLLPRAAFHSFEFIPPPNTPQEIEEACVSLLAFLEMTAEAGKAGIRCRFELNTRINNFLWLEWRGVQDGVLVSCKLNLFEGSHIPQAAMSGSDGLKLILTADQFKSIFGDFRMSDQACLQVCENLVKVKMVGASGTEFTATHVPSSHHQPWTVLACGDQVYEAVYRASIFCVIGWSALVADKISISIDKMSNACLVNVLCPLASATEPAIMHYTVLPMAE